MLANVAQLLVEGRNFNKLQAPSLKLQAPSFKRLKKDTMN